MKPADVFIAVLVMAQRLQALAKIA